MKVGKPLVEERGWVLLLWEKWVKELPSNREIEGFL